MQLQEADTLVIPYPYDRKDEQQETETPQHVSTRADVNTSASGQSHYSSIVDAMPHIESHYAEVHVN
jgi:hypothetical protein